MYDDQGTATTQQFAEGTTVYDAAGEKIGTVSEHNVQGGYLVLHKGWLFPKDVYVPLDTVQRNDADGVYLTLFKQDITDNPQYDHPPIGGSEVVDDSGTATTGMQAGMATTSAAQTTDTVSDTMTDQDIRVPVVEEELIAGKRQEELGRVHLHKDVVEEEQSVPVELRREQVEVERVPVQGQTDVDTTDAFTERDIDVSVMGEEAVIDKQTRVAEEVRLHKDAMTEEQQVSDTVRKERVYVDEDGGPDQTGASTEKTAETTGRVSSKRMR